MHLTSQFAQYLLQMKGHGLHSTSRYLHYHPPLPFLKHFDPCLQTRLPGVKIIRYFGSDSRFWSSISKMVANSMHCTMETCHYSARPPHLNLHKGKNFAIHQTKTHCSSLFTVTTIFLAFFIASKLSFTSKCYTKASLSHFYSTTNWFPPNHTFPS